MNLLMVGGCGLAQNEFGNDLCSDRYYFRLLFFAFYYFCFCFNHVFFPSAHIRCWGQLEASLIKHWNRKKWRKKCCLVLTYREEIEREREIKKQRKNQKESERKKENNSKKERKNYAKNAFERKSWIRNYATQKPPANQREKFFHSPSKKLKWSSF